MDGGKAMGVTAKTVVEQEESEKKRTVVVVGRETSDGEDEKGYRRERRGRDRQRRWWTALIFCGGEEARACASVWGEGENGARATAYLKEPNGAGPVRLTSSGRLTGFSNCCETKPHPPSVRGPADAIQFSNH
ncbi:hypothetical protein PIB30_060623 [Stylosanthes scabra]|uniref:Uncharacterized protein n=1 Tax=Stylosanthes scabra TaxID=79078 RepID=A0ABU6XKW7_9FABA|nr:hypothetical protein [Stylosanthes scabra]